MQVGCNRMAATYPDCGFATFADNPICSMQVAEANLAVIALAARRFAPG